MNKIRSTCLAVTAFLVASCAGTPAGTQAYPIYVMDGCAAKMSLGNVPGGSEFGVIVATVMVGFDATLYGACKVEHLMHRAPPSSVADGTYRSNNGLFSVELPAPTPDSKAPSLDIIEPDLPPSNYAIFQPQDAGKFPASGPALYAARVTGPLQGDEAGMTLEQYAHHEMEGKPLAGSASNRSNSQLAYQEQLTLQGQPALFSVYTDKLSISGGSPEPVFELGYVIRLHSRMALMVIVIRGDCPKCAVPGESQIRDSDPRIAGFVQSFHFVDPEAAAAH
jgi:hypothetical protein